jgi:endoglucanase
MTSLYRRLFWASTLAVCLVAELAGPVSATDPWRVDATVAAGTDGVHVVGRFTSPSGLSGTVILDTEIYDGGNHLVRQWSPVVTVNAGVAVAEPYDIAPGDLPAGLYTVKQGVFSTNWATRYVWSSGSAGFLVPAGEQSVPPLTEASPTTVAPMPTTAPPVPTTDRPPAPLPPAGGGTQPASSNPLAGASFWGPNAAALNQAAAWASNDPADAAKMNRLGHTPTAQWFGDWDADVRGDVAAATSAAAAAGQVPVLVAYDIPNRDCGSFSGGGAAGESAYDAWISAFAAGLGSGRAVVVVEPDALAQLCGDTAARYRMLNHAVDALAADPNALVYLDAGHAHWVDATTMAGRLQQAGVASARGFALNVSNFVPTAATQAYGETLSATLNGAHYVVDTSRNGAPAAPPGWCNPAGAKVGSAPTAGTGAAHADAYLWVKIPGASDGACGGGPSAGSWWASYALALTSSW